MIDLSAASGEQNTIVFKVVPLSGEEVMTFDITQSEPLYYFHTINAWEITGDESGSLGVVMDMSCLSTNMLPYFTLEMERSKAIRDQSNFGSIVVKRFTLWLHGPDAGTWTVETLTDPKRSTDFPTFNRALAGQPSCVFYALQVCP